MTELEKLSKLVKTALRVYGHSANVNLEPNEFIAKYLVDHGVIAPPIKVGQSIWTAENFTDNVPREGYITVIEYDCNGSYEFWTSFGEIPLSAEFSSEEIGKTVFLSREEAEKGLKEREG